jgi:hypothetical protein
LNDASPADQGADGHDQIGWVHWLRKVLWNPLLPMAVTRSSERAYAVNAAAGIRFAGARSVRLMVRISARPSIFGMPMSAMRCVEVTGLKQVECALRRPGRRDFRPRALQDHPQQALCVFLVVDRKNPGAFQAFWQSIELRGRDRRR